MNNEEKARQIIGEDCRKERCLECGGRYSAEKGGCVQFQKIMEMAQWKDEQYRQKLEMILNAPNEVIRIELLTKLINNKI